ncbi:MAG: hypothetical protein K0Q75_759 [Anaerospora sp.]|nr:hypothetical protein [Anaerospora sp.]
MLTDDNEGVRKIDRQYSLIRSDEVLVSWQSCELELDSVDFIAMQGGGVRAYREYVRRYLIKYGSGIACK